MAERDSEVRLPPGTFKVIDRAQTGYFDANEEGMKTYVVVVEYRPATLHEEKRGEGGELRYRAS